MVNYFLEIEYENPGDHSRKNLMWCRRVVIENIVYIDL